MRPLLAGAAAWSHAAYIAFLLVGGFLALRWRGVLRYHALAVVGMAFVSGLGLDCPFTTIEKHFMTSPYEGGFVEHYLVEPIHPEGITPAVRAIIIASWILPTALAYVLLGRRRQQQPA